MLASDHRPQRRRAKGVFNKTRCTFFSFKGPCVPPSASAHAPPSLARPLTAHARSGARPASPRPALGPNAPTAAGSFPSTWRARPSSWARSRTARAGAVGRRCRPSRAHSDAATKRRYQSHLSTHKRCSTSAVRLAMASRSCACRSGASRVPPSSSAAAARARAARPRCDR